MVQFARPIEDAHAHLPNPEGDIEAQDGWTGTLGEEFDLWSNLIQFTPNDTDFVTSELMRGPDLPQDAEPYVLKFGPVEKPEVAYDLGLKVRMRLGKNEDDGVIVSCTVELRQEYNHEGEHHEAGGDLGTLLKSVTFDDIPSGFTEYQMEISAQEAQSITDFEDLYLRFVFNSRFKHQR